jgi:hypothetical protein
MRDRRLILISSTSTMPGACASPSDRPEQGPFRALGEEQQAFIAHAWTQRIDWAEASSCRPASESDGLVYSSHMIDLTRDIAAAFRREAFRVLIPGGWIRIAAPGPPPILAQSYKQGKLDADAFVASTLMASERPRGALARISLAAIGPRYHLWMYDGSSLRKLLVAQGFVTTSNRNPRPVTCLP